MNILAFPSWGPMEWVVIGLVAVLLFGRRLPEVGRNLGRSLVEFKRGLKNAGDEMKDVHEAVDDVKEAARTSAEDSPADRH
ncbi:MAG: twin-arginine translocase TatA/TatE family subunit [Planctomycetes bacterium]|nr:twin-arginine translocase TatA/TatE family subunit [Planctomycetota bacterium]